jgi:molybdopterin/thiamine biosynthesis adenylyltransferase
VNLQVDLSPDGRYSRQELISWWEQDRLANARILVVGAGALGNELVKNLALLGIGTIVVVDLDCVENSNLARCVMFREGDDGAPKAEVVASAGRHLNSEINIVPVVGDVRIALGLGVFAGCDLVLGGLDNREARLHINQACWKVGIPWVDGAIEGLMGLMRVFNPPDSACYECTMTARDHQLISARRACTLLTRDQMLAGKVPTTVTSASVIAALQAQEAVKLLHSDLLPYTFAGMGVAFNGITHDTYPVTYARQDDCLSHDTYPRADWREVESTVSFGSLLAMASSEFGEDAVLDLEQEVVRSFACPRCGLSQIVLRPLPSLAASSGVCPNCEGDRSPTLLHSISLEDTQLLSLSPSDLGLPDYDVVTARSGERRRFFQIGLGDPVAALS